MDRKRLEELEKNVSEISSEYDELMDIFYEWKKEMAAGNEEKAWEIRKKADPWIYDEDGKFTSLAYHPPENADVKGIIHGPTWMKFVKNW